MDSEFDLKGDTDYIEFAANRSRILQDHLQTAGVNSLSVPFSVFGFFDRREYYLSLDREKYVDSKPVFIFCGLMYDAYTIVSEKGEEIQSGTSLCLELASQAVEALVFSIAK